MSPEEMTAVFVFVTHLIALGAGFFAGLDHANTKRARRDLADAEKIRAAIRNLDDRVAEFAPIAVSNAESFLLGDVAGASSTALASLPPPPPARRCPIGPEQCCCEQCLASGIPPRP